MYKFYKRLLLSVPVLKFSRLLPGQDVKLGQYRFHLRLSCGLNYNAVGISGYIASNGRTKVNVELGGFLRKQ
jgi:hypothetical protein